MSNKINYINMSNDLITFSDKIIKSVDLLSLNELSESIQQLPSYFSIEQELNETKYKLGLLEERLKKLENSLNSNQTFSIIPLNSGLLDINCEKIYMNFDMIQFDSYTCFLWIHCLINSNNNTISKFFNQFQNIKIIEIEFNNKIFYQKNETEKESKKVICNILESLIDINDNLDIIFKCDIIEDNFKAVFHEFMNTPVNKKIILEIIFNCSNIIDIYEEVLNEFMNSTYYKNLIVTNYCKNNISYQCKINKNNYYFIKNNIAYQYNGNNSTL